MSTNFHIKRTEIFKTKGRLSEPPLFDAESLPSHQIARLNSKLAELTDTNTTDIGDLDDENT